MKIKLKKLVICLSVFAIICVSVICITTTSFAAETYTASFVEQSGLKPTVTVYSDSSRTNKVNASELSANTTYYYTAKLKSYKNYTGAFRVRQENANIYFTMQAADHAGILTVNYVDENNNIVKTEMPDISGSYEDEVYIFYYPIYIEANNIYYQTSEKSYCKSVICSTAPQTINIQYEAVSDNIVYYVEGESFSEYGIDYASMSNGGYGGTYHVRQSIPTLMAGQYEITVKVVNNQSAGRGICLREEETIIHSMNIPQLYGRVYQNMYTEYFTLTKQTDLTLYGNSSATTANFDYLVIKKIGDYNPPIIKGSVSAIPKKNYTGDNGNASVWTATFDNNTGYIINTVSAEAISNDGDFVASPDKKITAISSGTVSIAVVVNKSQAELADVTVLFK